MIAVDILLDENNDAQTRFGDFVLDESEGQNIQLMLMSAQGTWKQSPYIGVNLAQELNGSTGAVNINAIRQRIQLNAEMDGLTIKEMKLGDLRNLKIDAFRK